jgi:hypothetical protein
MATVMTVLMYGMEIQFTSTATSLTVTVATAQTAMAAVTQQVHVVLAHPVV